MLQVEQRTKPFSLENVGKEQEMNKERRKEESAYKIAVVWCLLHFSSLVTRSRLRSSEERKASAHSGPQDTASTMKRPSRGREKPKLNSKVLRNGLVQFLPPFHPKVI